MVTDASALHEEMFVMDGLSPSGLTEEYVTETLPGAGVDAKHETVAGANDDFRSAVENIVRYQRLIDGWPTVTQARTAAELRDGDGLRILFGFQNTSPLEDDPYTTLRAFHQLGVRIVQLTYNARNLCANGCTERVDDGLSNYGYEVIRAIEDHDVILDLSHVGPTSAMEALEAATQPTVFSHSNPKGVLDHPRNISDEHAKAAADTGGFVGVNAFPDLVAAEDPTVEDLVDHVEYLVDLVGSRHVTLGLDFIDNRDVNEMPFLDNPYYSDPPYRYPKGLESAAGIPNITAAMVDRGLSERTIRRVMGENLLRVYESVWGE